MERCKGSRTQWEQRRGGESRTSLKGAELGIKLDVWGQILEDSGGHCRHSEALLIFIKTGTELELFRRNSHAV